MVPQLYTDVTLCMFVRSKHVTVPGDGECSTTQSHSHCHHRPSATAGGAIQKTDCLDRLDREPVRLVASRLLHHLLQSLGHDATCHLSSQVSWKGNSLELFRIPECQWLWLDMIFFWCAPISSFPPYQQLHRRPRHSNNESTLYLLSCPCFLTLSYT